MWEVPSELKALVLPPAILVVIAALGWLLGRRRPRAGRALITVAVVALFLLSTPFVGGLLRRSLETIPPLAPTAAAAEADAIVVLSAGLYRDAPEYGGDTVGAQTLERIRYAARLHRSTGGVPLLTSGGRLQEGDAALGDVMAAALAEDFGLTVRWVERESRNTFQNATFSRRLLREAGVDTVYLVTHAQHMPRAKAAFEAAGFAVVPAPTGFAPAIAPEANDFVPTLDGLGDSTMALYEWLARLWYTLAYG